MPASVRFVLYWTDRDGTHREETFEGRGAYMKALAMRDRMPEDSAAFVVKEELLPVLTWCKAGVVDDPAPRNPKQGA